MNYPKAGGVVAFVSFFFLLSLVELPFPKVRNYFTQLPNWTLLMIASYWVLAIVVLILGSNFSLLNSVKIKPRRGEWAFAVSLGAITWYLFLVYFIHGYLGFLLQYLGLTLNLFNSMLLFLIVTGIFFAVTFNASSRGIGIALILPFSILTFLRLFLYTWTRYGGQYGYFIGVALIVVELVVLGVFLTERRRQWANYGLSLIFVGSVVYGILVVGQYYQSNWFYIWSLTTLMVSVVMIGLFFIKPTHLPFSGSFRFGKGKRVGRALLVLVVFLFLVGFYLIIPLVTITPSYLLISYAFVFMFAGALFYFMNFQSSTRVTDSVTYILIAAVAIYGLRYLVSIAPTYVISGATPKFSFWLVLSALIMYEPSFTVTNYISGNRLNPNFSLTYLYGRWRRRSKLLNGRYDISQTPFKKSGGNANIYEAYDVRERSDVIVKIPVILCRKCNHREETIPISGRCPKCGTRLDVQDFFEAMKVLKDEVNALSYLDSEYIVKQLDHFDWGGKTYLVEERVTGSSFREVFVGNPIGEKKMLELIKMALHGINHAHMHGIIHRDLNTGNLMLTSKNEVKIIDFGTVKFKTRTTQSKGKPSIGGKFGTDYFSPPESYYVGLIPKKEPAFSYDVYSLGCIMYVLLVGDYPTSLDQTSVKSIYPNNKYREDFMRELSTKCSPPILNVILKATAFFPEERYQSAFEMICAIERLKGEFLVTRSEQAFSFPSPSTQSFSSEIVLGHPKQLRAARGPSFNAIKKAINMEAQFASSKKQPNKYDLSYDQTLTQFKITPKNSRLFFWYHDNDNRLILRQSVESGVYLGREILLFSPTNNLGNVAFAYYKVS